MRVRSKLSVFGWTSSRFGLFDFLTVGTWRRSIMGPPILSVRGFGVSDCLRFGKGMAAFRRGQPFPVGFGFGWSL
jgi:hypothetical protein